MFCSQFVIYWLFKNGANEIQHQESHQRETIPDKSVFFFFPKLVRQKSQWDEQNTCMYVSEICAEGIFCNFLLVTKNVKSRSNIALFFKWAPFWNFISKKRKQLRFSEVNYLKYTKRPNFALDNYIFPKTRGNKNKQWPHITPLRLFPKMFRIQELHD